MQGERLESWKEIATYLNRGIRTVQRWEKQEGLPVHRHVHEKLGSVYALRPEIDAWWDGRKAGLAGGETETPDVAPIARTPWWRRPVVLVAATVGVAALLVGVTRPTGRSPAARTAGLTPVFVTTLPGSELFPSASPDGASVAFTWSRPDGPLNIFVKRIEAEGLRRITETEEVDLGSAWSPDGGKIAFLRGIARKGPLCRVVVASLDGGGETVVAETEKDWGPFLSWTPDSHGLVFSECRAPNPCALKLIRLDTKREHYLTSPQPGTPGDTSPSISPDGKSLLFLRRTTDSTTVQLQRLAGGSVPAGDPVQLTSDSMFATAPTWAADGRTFFFLSGEEGVGMKLWRMAPDRRAEPTLLATMGDTLYEAGIAVTGNKVITVDLRFDINIHRVERRGSRSTLTTSNRSDTFPHFSPDGAKVAFESTRLGGSDIFLMNADGSGVERLTHFGRGRAETPRWSPDGKRIVFAAGVSPGDIYVVPSGGGKPALVIGGPENDFLPSWSADGRWMYFTSTRGGKEDIWKAPVDGGGAPVQLTRNGGCRPIASDDGRFVYYTRRKRQASQGANLWRVGVDGGGETQVFERLVYHSENFDVNGRMIYYAGSLSEPRKKGIRVFDPSDGSDRELIAFGGPLRKGLTVARGGSVILYTQLDYHNADLVMFEVQ
jgi:Tol biopolymer transport system component